MNWLQGGVGLCLWAVLAGVGVAQSAPAAQPVGPAVAAAGVTAAAQAQGSSDKAVLQARPALWRVTGAHATVYLFGTVHIMKPEVHWQTSVITDAFQKSGTLELEIANVTDLAAAQPLVLQYGLDREHPLSSKLSKEDLARLDTAVKGMGLPGESAMEPMQPWLAYMTVSALPMLRSGFAPTSGVDVVLQGMAKQAGKRVEGLETLEQQIHLLADMPAAEQVRLLHEELQDLQKPDSQKQMLEMVDDWTRGDVAAIGKLEDGEMRTREPALFQQMVVQRNQRWADTLAAVLRGSQDQTVFVAVGAAHLAGPAAVQTLLENKGFAVTRLE